MNKSVRRFAFVMFCLLITKISAAQSIPPLERNVTITFTNEKFDVVLSRLSQQGKFTFSYNPEIFDGSRSYSGSFTNKAVREILNQLFDGTIQYKTKGNYIILTRAPTPQQKTSAEKPLVISGYVVNGETGEKISEVSIYDKKTLAAVISNSFGYFKLRIDKPSEINTISFNKRTYKDTLISVSNGEDRFINILMNPDVIITISPPENNSDSSKQEPLAREEEKEESEPMKESQVNMRNIKDTLYSEFQVSFVPFVGTHAMLSGNVISDYSINILGGYTFGVRRLEIGGIFNIDRGDVQHAQIAGVFNAVNGNVKGFQGAGNVNLVRGRVDGVQFAGTMNINLGGMEGPQFAGIMNVNTSASRGAQFAGVMNVQVQDFRGSQFAAGLNVATHMITGTQVAAVNYGTHVHGSQIGVLNISDSVRGVPIGIFSYVRRGYHKIELSADEIFYTNLAFRTGVHQFYNIFSASIKPDDFGDPFWAMGYGIGTAPRLAKWLYLNFDLQSSHVSQGHLQESLSLLNKAYLGFDIQVARKFSITAGATLNGYLTDRAEEYPSLFTNNTPHLIYDDDVGDKSHLQMWWGWKVGLRFL